MSDALVLIGIGMEVAVIILGLMIALQKKRSYGWFIALSFTIYVFYDFLHYIQSEIPFEILISTFVIASVSSLYAVWQIYNKK